jgi:MFS family permease
MNPIISYIIQNFGWRTAYVANAIIAGAVVLPFLIFVIRLKPADKGLKPYGYAEQADNPPLESSKAEAVSTAQATGVSRGEAVRSASFVFMILLFAASGYFAGYTQHLTAYGISIGLTATFSSLLLSLTMIGNVLSKLALGFINDKFGGKPMIFTTLGFALASLLLLMVGASYLPALLAGALFAGFLLSISSVAAPLFTQTVYGARDYIRILVLLSLSQNVFLSLGPTIVGFMFDNSSSYSLPLTVGAIVAVASVALALSSIKTSRKLI